MNIFVLKRISAINIDELNHKKYKKIVKKEADFVGRLLETYHRNINIPKDLVQSL
jgi:predicted secreted protein